MSGPIEGYRVIELAQGIPGAVAGMHLGDGGADVIKIETPQGDYARGMPPFYESGVPGGKRGDSGVFIAVNRNKRSVVLDLASDDGREALRALIAGADVLIEDADFTRELGIDTSELISGDQLVHCRISGFGPSGPLSGLPGSEITAQMASEATLSLGSLDAPPERLGTDAASTYSGIYAAQAVLAALWRRHQDGRGQRVDVSLFGSMLEMRVTLWAALSNPDEWYGFHNDSYVRPPETGYQCKDGTVTLVVGRINDEQWQRLIQELGLDQLSEDDQRTARREVGSNSRQGHLYKHLWERFLRNFTVDEVAGMFNRHGGNAYRHNTYPDVFSHPQTIHLDITQQVEGPSGPVTVMKPPWTFSDTPVSVRLPPPALGQHTAEVLAELGIVT